VKNQCHIPELKKNYAKKLCKKTKCTFFRVGKCRIQIIVRKKLKTVFYFKMTQFKKMLLFERYYHDNEKILIPLFSLNPIQGTYFHFDFVVKFSQTELKKLPNIYLFCYLAWPLHTKYNKHLSLR
jgi:hypothetical protein